jgi:hypothetical protein
MIMRLSDWMILDFSGRWSRVYFGRTRSGENKIYFPSIVSSVSGPLSQGFLQGDKEKKKKKFFWM